MNWRRGVLAAVAPAVVLGPAVAAGAAARRPPEVQAVVMPGVGRVLADGHRFALYVFAPDRRHRVTCRGDCAQAWPPLLEAGTAAVAGPGLRRGLLGTVANPTGGRQVTYDGWPLYLYTGDLAPGEADGQGLDRNGGDWYTISPSGRPVRR